ncbi:DeoR family transcriptional regulator [Paractinoplanes durhamensis]|uniref:DeoR family transcriptional regulator n=1 Tax=Paractinoplanes durhamensis TaxID=113563 RepID=UPI003634AA95
MTLFQVQRHERLMSELQQHGAVRVSEIARDLGVSELTIRRDIAALAARNLVTRVHGGATLPSRARPIGRPRTTALTVGMVVPSSTSTGHRWWPGRGPPRPRSASPSSFAVPPTTRTRTGGRSAGSSRPVRCAGCCSRPVWTATTR